MTISVDLGGAFAALDADADAMVEAARPAAQAGAQVLYEAVKANVASLKRSTGNLQRSIYQAHSPEKSVGGRQVYNISWNYLTAPHGHLVEYGYIQRYKMAQLPNGQVMPMLKPGATRPKKGASRAAMDAAYVPLAGGPRQVPGRSFIRSAQAQFPKAQAAMEARWLEELQKKGVIK